MSDQRGLIVKRVRNIMLSMALLGPGSFVGFGQTPAPQAPHSPNPSRPDSLAHLYWHFLAYQNHLSEKASELDAHGKDGTQMRNHLRERLGLADSDFAPIRISSARLAGEIETLNAKALTIRASGTRTATEAALKALTAEREADIDAEIAYLRSTLSAKQIASFESFLERFFSPQNATPRASGSAGPTLPTGGK